MHDGESKMKGSERLHSWKTGREVAAELDCNGSLQQRDRVVQNKAE